MKKTLLLLAFIFLLPTIVKAEPFGGVITSYYGHRIHPIFGTEQYHGGMDVAGFPENTIVPTTVSGKVIVAGWVNGFGNAVYVLDKNGYTHIFAHNNSVLVREGDTVSQGQKVALAGSTGYSTGVHVHYQVELSGEKQDPMPFALRAGWVLDGSITGEIGVAIQDVWDSLGLKGYSFESYHEIGKNFDDGLLSIITALLASLLKLEALFYSIPLLASIDLVIRTYKNDGFVGKNNTSMYLNLIMKYGFVCFLFVNWTWILEYFFKSFVLTISDQLAFANNNDVEDVIMQPSLFLQKTIALLEPFMNYVEKGASILNLSEWITIAITFILIHIVIALAVILIIILATKVIYFYIAGITSLVAIPFGALKESNRIYKMGFAGIISASLELLITIVLFFVVADELSNAKVENDMLPSLIMMTVNYIGILISFIYIPKIFVSYFGGSD